MVAITLVCLAFASILASLVAGVYLHRQVISPWLRRRAVARFWRNYAVAKPPARIVP